MSENNPVTRDVKFKTLIDSSITQHKRILIRHKSGCRSHERHASVLSIVRVKVILQRDHAGTLGKVGSMAKFQLVRTSITGRETTESRPASCVKYRFPAFSKTNHDVVNTKAFRR